jgi:hypothetical protein
MEASGQIYAPAVLYQGEESLVFIEYEAGLQSRSERDRQSRVPATSLYRKLLHFIFITALKNFA